MCAPQYPGEKEITFPPFTCLESSGDARLERDAIGNEVVIFPLKVPPPRACARPSPLRMRMRDATVMCAFATRTTVQSVFAREGVRRRR
jgi:hypothetical protein